MKRRFVLMGVAGLAGLAAAGVSRRFWPDDGLVNPCLEGPVPPSLLDHDLVASAWEGIDPEACWDGHVHLVGTGDSGSGLWLNPDMDSLLHPIQRLQKAFYLNASCTVDDGGADRQYLERLGSLLEVLPAGVRVLLLAFDWFHDEQGQRQQAASAFHIPNEYAATAARERPGRFEWMASIHPYRRDAAEALRRAAVSGARAVKWLPPAQGMDPASPLCDSFYETAAELDMPLLVHAGAELAVHGGNTEDFGNPLRLRRPLEHGVRVAVAHCATLGSSPDLDAGPGADKRPCFELFARLMDEPAWEGRLFGDISAITQVNRYGNGLQTLLQREDWHHRLINGSDYPLPGILPLFSLRALHSEGFITERDATTLSEIRRYNPLLFDFVLKRTVRSGGRRFADQAFQTRRFFEH